MTASLHWARALIMTVGVAVLSTCGGPIGPQIDLTFTAPAEVATVEISATLDGVAAVGGPLRRTGVSGFTLQLPAAAQGTLRLEVSGRNHGDCRVAQGTAEQPVTAAGHQQMSITLSSMTDRTCRLIVEQGGFGSARIVSEPPSIDCKVARCAGEFPFNKPVELRLQEIDSFFDSWAGACGGRDRCSVTIGEAAKTVRVNLTQPRLCNKDRWCFENPLKGDSALGSLWGASNNDVWAVGERGLALHWDGLDWTPVPTGVTSTLNHISGTGPNDIWALSDKDFTVTHWDGLSWSVVPTKIPFDSGIRLNDIWASARDDVWIAGNGTNFHWDGRAWTPVFVGDDIGSLWGSGPKDIWGIGFASNDGSNLRVILHWNGTAWSRAYSNPTSFLRGIWGSSATDVWVVGDRLILRWDGLTWATVTPAFAEGLRSVWGRSASDVWALDNNNFLHWDGGAWSKVPYPALLRPALLRGSPGGDIWGPTGNVLARWNGQQWDGPFATVSVADLRSAWGLAPDDVWAAGREGVGGVILHWDGRSWSRSHRGTNGVDGPATAFQALSGTSPNDIWAVGKQIYHWDGKEWAERCPGTATAELQGVWPIKTQDAWIIGESGRMLHWDGKQCAGVATDTAEVMQGIWGSNDGKDAWAVGEKGAILHWDGQRWSTVESGTTQKLGSVWGSGPTDVWAVGYGKLALHWDGTRWNPNALDVFQCSGMWGSGPNDYWTSCSDSGNDQTYIYHWDGQRWSRGAAVGRVGDVWGAGPRDVWAVGKDGLIMRYRP